MLTSVTGGFAPDHVDQVQSIVVAGISNSIMIAETHRHAGHADVIRELIDGIVGLRPGNGTGRRSVVGELPKPAGASGAGGRPGFDVRTWNTACKTEALARISAESL